MAKINTAISQEGWADGTDLMNVDWMPHCPKCGYINRKTSSVSTAVQTQVLKGVNSPDRTQYTFPFW